MPTEINSLIQGYLKFRQKYFTNDKQLFKQLVKDGQKPKILVVACSDSRVDPSIILNCKPGDLFVIRNVANLIPPCEDTSSYHGTSAALEFAICKLQIRHIIILGHSKCGGISSLFDNSIIDEHDNDFISKWMQIARPAKIKTNQQADNLDEKINQCAKYSLINSVGNLLTFEWISERIKKNNLFIHAWYFDLEQGIIEAYQPNLQEFIELEKL